MTLLKIISLDEGNNAKGQDIQTVYTHPNPFALHNLIEGDIQNQRDHSTYTGIQEKNADIYQ